MVLLLFIVLSVSCAIDAALRVFGGRDVDPEEYPYVVSIKMKITENEQNTSFIHMCTASVLTPVWTLSAGHCCDFKYTTDLMQAHKPTATINYVISYGLTIANLSSTERFSDIIESVQHPAYRSQKIFINQYIVNDIGLLKTKPITLHQYGRLSAVEYLSLAGQEAVAMGYGLMLGDSDSFSIPTNFGKPLQALDVLIKPCAKHLIRVSYSPIICLSRKCHQLPAPSLCPGDSGGPLIHFSGLVGVHHKSFHSDCTLRNAQAGVSSNRVATLTPISPYVEWIADQIRKN